MNKFYNSCKLKKVKKHGDSCLQAKKLKTHASFSSSKKLKLEKHRFDFNMLEKLKNMDLIFWKLKNIKKHESL